MKRRNFLKTIPAGVAGITVSSRFGNAEPIYNISLMAKESPSKQLVDILTEIHGSKEGAIRHLVEARLDQTDETEKVFSKITRYTGEVLTRNRITVNGLPFDKLNNQEQASMENGLFQTWSRLGIPIRHNKFLHYIREINSTQA